MSWDDCVFFVTFSRISLERERERERKRVELVVVTVLVDSKHMTCHS